MKKRYENTLQLMCQGNEDLSKIINDFVDNFPEAIKSKIKDRKQKGIAVSDDKRWVFIEGKNDFSVSVGKNSSSSSKDYMNLYLTGIDDERLKLWPRFEGEKLVGYVTIYLYDDENKRAKPLQLNYDFYVKRIDKDLYVTVTSRFNSVYKENARLLEKYGLTEIHNSILQGYYKVDVKKILGSEGR